MTYEYITVEQVEGVVTLTLNWAAAPNALKVDMLAEMTDAVDRVRDGGTARALLLTGTGRAFSSGADLTSGSELELYYNPLLERLFALPLPFITAVNGPAVGAGCAFALAGDIVFRKVLRLSGKNGRVPFLAGKPAERGVGLAGKAAQPPPPELVAPLQVKANRIACRGREVAAAGPKISRTHITSGPAVWDDSRRTD